MRLVSRVLLRSALSSYQESREPEEEDLPQYMYSCDKSRLAPELSRCFVELGPDDEETQAFLASCRRHSSNLCLHLLYNCLRMVLCLFLSQTSINGLLETGKMFLFSRQQLCKLLPVHQPWPLNSVMEIGAGDGNISEKYRSLGAASVCATEASGVMRRVLRKKGFKVLDVETWDRGPHKYDVVSCLNVLDRCSRPLSLLRQMADKLDSGGLLVLALVFPFEPFVENVLGQKEPAETMPALLQQGEWEDMVSTLWRDTLQPMGFQPVSLTRLPYLCEGDYQTEYYYLDDAVLVVQKC